MIGVGEIQLDKSPCSNKLFKQLANQRQQILVFDSNIIKALIIDTKAEASIWLLIKGDKCSDRDLEGEIKLLARLISM